MNITSIVTQLKQERDRLDNAIRALEGMGNHHRPTGSFSSPKRRLSAVALKRIREAQKKRWAAWRVKQKSKS
jgi:hypothetical protein